ncbi:GNAT family N-acetyltransferase [Flavobacterium luminosum]|uniref:GNAT family N-acetyltransferase n=1 Tax=Flavobacterium luminosum TaxID=2949086 RepID=A0ABT0TKA5_9FLAO|nr:GNAT family N-acetyltransferase [Flavobacterium sp. HXWNR70]MCL9807835.1 GNAT family N-acetyltransferase [Flavobacterium sp. HXWNR70]
MSQPIIREIQKEDNPHVARLIRSIFEELGAPKVGTAYADPQLDFMFENYDVPSASYFVIEQDGEIIGGAGVAALEEGMPEICELQKMYFLPQARGLGLGAKMMQTCLDRARSFGFKKCYLETLPMMEAAQKLYVKSGFEYLKEPLGSTGHSSCPVWMIKEL